MAGELTREQIEAIAERKPHNLNWGDVLLTVAERRLGGVDLRRR